MIRVLLFFIFVLHPLATNAIRYEFQGLNYNNIVGSSYTEEMRLAGYIEVRQELEPLSEYQDEIIIGYRFNDGVQILDETNSDMTLIRINTDANGLPSLYQLTFTKMPLPNAIGESFSQINLYFGWNTEGYERSEGGYNQICLIPGEQVCSTYDELIDSGGYETPGLGGGIPANWSLLRGSDIPQSVPTVSAWSLLIIFVLFLVVFFNYRRTNNMFNHRT